MASAFPSLSAFGGASGIGKLRPKLANQDRTLSDLNQDYARMVDTFIYDYPQLVRDNQRPFAKVNDAGKDIKVAVIGAGFAGATAVYELRRAGIEHITVYEGRQIGGRADSRTFTYNDQDYINEMGPMRVPENSKLFWHYLSQLVDDDSMQTIFPNPGVVATELVYRGVAYTWKDEGYPQPVNADDPRVVDWGQLSEDLGMFINSLEDDQGNTLAEITQLLQKVILTNAEKEKICSYWSYFLNKYDDVSFIGALEQYFDGQDGRPDWGAKEYNMFSTLGLGTGGFGPLFPVCFLEIFRLFLWEYHNEYSASLPMTDIVKGLLGYDLDNDSPPDDVTICEQAVTYVALNGDKVNVYSIDPDEESADDRVVEHEYDYVIIATTLRSMEIGMNLDAKVPPTRYLYENYNNKAVFRGEPNHMLRESLRIPHIMNSSKLFGFLETKPWIDNDDWPHHNDDPIKCVLTDTLARQMYYLDPYPEDDNAGSNVLISYNWGDDSVKIMGILDYEQDQVIDPSATANYHLKEAYQTALDTTRLVSPVAQSLEQITIEDQDEYLQSVVWQQESMIFGAFKIDYPNQYYYTSQIVYQYQYANSGPREHSKRVYLAGNNVSYQGGWIEGAMQSAVNAVSAVLKHMFETEMADDFRMQELFEPNPFQDVLDSMDVK